MRNIHAGAKHDKPEPPPRNNRANLDYGSLISARVAPAKRYTHAGDDDSC